MEQRKEFKVNNFDLLRLIAATQVIVDHYFQHLNIPLSNFSVQLLYLFPGVPTFFVISGYLISASYERKNDLGIYFRNRALRIFPGLWGCVCVTMGGIAITGVSFFNKQVIAWLPAQLIGVIYTPGFLANYGFGSYNGSLWTIPIELQFYILLPLCYCLIPKGKFNNWLYGLFMIFLLCSFLYESKIIHYEFQEVHDRRFLFAKLLRYSFIPHFYLFLTGVILQRLRIYQSSLICNKALYWIIGYVLFSLTFPNYFNPTLFLLIKNLLLAITIISVAYTIPTLAMKLLRGNDISYGIYIYHGLLLTVIVQEKWQSQTNIYCVILLAYVMGALSWLLIEKPFIKRKEKTIRKIV